MRTKSQFANLVRMAVLARNNGFATKYPSDTHLVFAGEMKEYSPSVDMSVQAWYESAYAMRDGIIHEYRPGYYIRFYYG